MLMQLISRSMPGWPIVALCWYFPLTITRVSAIVSLHVHSIADRKSTFPKTFIQSFVVLLWGGRHTVDRQMGECIILHNYDRWENHCGILTCGRMTCSPIFAFFHLLVVMGQMGEWGLIILPFVTIKWQIESNGRMYGLSDEVENLLMVGETRSGPNRPVAAIGRCNFLSNSMK